MTNPLARAKRCWWIAALAWLGGCAQPWVFSPSTNPAGRPIQSYDNSDSGRSGRAEPLPYRDALGLEALPAPASPQVASNQPTTLPGNSPPVETRRSNVSQTAWDQPNWPGAPSDPNPPGPGFADPSGSPIPPSQTSPAASRVFAQPGSLAQSGPPQADQSTALAEPQGVEAAIASDSLVTMSEPGRHPGLLGWWENEKRLVKSDYKHYYSWPTMRDMMLGMAFPAALANTRMDQHFHSWYQESVRSPSTDGVSKVFKQFGEGGYVIPAALALEATGRLLDNYPLGHAVGDYGNRVTRAYLVGAPPMLFMQYTLGASRPEERPFASQWRPYADNNAVSGHAFMGSVPFITAAQMTDNWGLKGCFYACSTLTAWSRVNDDKHFVSQAILGWWMGYLACRAVNQTDLDERPISFSPIASPEMTGVLFVYKR